MSILDAANVAIPTLIGVWSAAAAFSLGFDARRRNQQRAERERTRQQVLELQDQVENVAARAGAMIADDPAMADEAAVITRLRDELAEARSKLLELDSTVPFEREAGKANRYSIGAFMAGLMVVGIVIAIGLDEWLEEPTGAGLTTGDSIARVAVVGAAFYAAGQLFRRSATLQMRAQEFERAAIALRSAKSLSGDLSSEADRDGMVRAIYESHLVARPAIVDSAAADLSGVGDLVSRLRGG